MRTRPPGWTSGGPPLAGSRRRAEKSPARSLRAPRRLPRQPGLARPKLTMFPVWVAPTPPSALTWPRARAERTQGLWTVTPSSLQPRVLARLLCPQGHHSRLGAQARLWEPEVTAGDCARQQRTRAGVAGRPRRPRRVGAQPSAAPDHPWD